MIGTYCFAEKIIQVETLHPLVHQRCQEYSCTGPAELFVTTSQQDIEYERKKSARENERDGIPEQHYPDAYLEILAVYRKIAEQMPAFGTFLFHGSAIAVDGAAYIFTAKSGTGKSTHTRLWRELLGSRAVMVNDDKPLINVREDGLATVYGTPWDGKHHLSSNIAVPVKAICLLERAKQNTIRKITKEEALPMLLQQAYRPAAPEALARTLKLIDSLNVGFYRLGCNMDMSAAELSYNTMKEG